MSKQDIRNDKLPQGKTVIVGMEEADYKRLLLICDKQKISVASYIEDATIMRMNNEPGEWIKDE